VGQATTARAPGESIGVPLLARILAPILGPFAGTALSRSASLPWSSDFVVTGERQQPGAVEPHNCWLSRLSGGEGSPPLAQLRSLV